MKPKKPANYVCCVNQYDDLLSATISGIRAKFLILIGLLILFPLSIYAQFSVKGYIKDSDEVGVPFANVLLKAKSDSSLVKGAVTDENGFYSIGNINQGNYLIESYMVGYSKSYFSLLATQGQRELELEPIVLYEDTKELGAVVITADKPLYEMQMGKMVINVQKSITSAGLSVIDVLERSPGVLVNRQNGSFSLGGKDGVIVLMNGKRSRMPISAVYQMLEGMNAGDIEKIEIMTIPPANYDADGDAGFINIVMKKGSDTGTNGNVMVNAGYGTGPRFGGSVNLSHRSKGISIYGSYSVNYVDQLQTFDTYRESTSGSEGITSSTFTDRDPYRIAHNFQAGIDYSLGKNTVLGVLVSGYNNLWDMTSAATSEFNYAVSADTLVDMTMTEQNHWKHFMGNINLQHSFDGGQMLIANFDYLIYDNSNPTHYLYNYYDSQDNLIKNIENRVSKETPINMMVAKLDYTLPLGASTTIDVGIKGTFTDLTNNVAFEENVGDNWIADTLLSNYSNLTENVLAGYSALSIKFDDKTTMNAGLRYEHTETKLTSIEGESIVDRYYGDFFPTLYFSRKLNENNKLQFSYGRRITRPTFNEMAPFVIFIDPYTFFAGNTNILPTYTNSVKTDYSYKNFIFSLQYSHDNNVIFRFQPKYDSENNIMIIQTDNVDRRETFAGTITLPIYVNDWWTMQNNFSGNWQMIETATTSGRYARSQNAFTINSTQTFKLPKEFTLELTGFYQSPTIFGYMNLLPVWFVNLGLQKNFNNNGTLRISANDIFQSRKIRFETVNNPEVISKGALQFDKTVFTISYTQKFGNDKLKTRKHSGGSADEQRRVTN